MNVFVQGEVVPVNPLFFSSLFDVFTDFGKDDVFWPILPLGQDVGIFWVGFIAPGGKPIYSSRPNSSYKVPTPGIWPGVWEMLIAHDPEVSFSQ